LDVVWNSWYWIWTSQIFIKKLVFLSGCAHMKYLSHPPIQHWLRPSMTQWAHHSCFKILLFKCKVSNLISDCSKEFICSSWLSLLLLVVFWENTLYFLGLVCISIIESFPFPGVCVATYKCVYRRAIGSDMCRRDAWFVLAGFNSCN
jgi:hypothetical protein